MNKFLHVFTSASYSSTQRLMVSWILHSYFMIISSSPSLFLSHSNSEYLLRTLEWNKGNAGWFVCEQKIWLYQSNKLVDRPLNNNKRSWTKSKDNITIWLFVLYPMSDELPTMVSLGEFSSRCKHSTFTLAFVWPAPVVPSSPLLYEPIQKQWAILHSFQAPIFVCPHDL